MTMSDEELQAVLAKQDEFLPGTVVPSSDWLRDNFKAVILLPINSDKVRGFAHELDGKALIGVGVNVASPRYTEGKLKYFFFAFAVVGDNCDESSEYFDSPWEALENGIKWARQFKAFDLLPRVLFIVKLDPIEELDFLVVNGLEKMPEVTY